MPLTRCPTEAACCFAVLKLRTGRRGGRLGAHDRRYWDRHQFRDSVPYVRGFSYDKGHQRQWPWPMDQCGHHGTASGFFFYQKLAEPGLQGNDFGAIPSFFRNESICVGLRRPSVVHDSCSNRDLLMRPPTYDLYLQGWGRVAFAGAFQIVMLKGTKVFIVIGVSAGGLGLLLPASLAFDRQDLHLD